MMRQLIPVADAKTLIMTCVICLIIGLVVGMVIVLFTRFTTFRPRKKKVKFGTPAQMISKRDMDLDSYLENSKKGHGSVDGSHAIDDFKY